MTRRERSTGTIAYTLIFAMLLMTASLATVGWFAFFHVPNPIVLNVQPMPISPSIVKAGGTLTLTVDACRHTDVPALLFRSWVATDGLIDNQEPVGIAGIAPGCSIATFEIEVPLTLRPGEYRIHNKLEYWVNPVGRRIVIVESGLFTVVAATPPPFPQ